MCVSEAIGARFKGDSHSRDDSEIRSEVSLAEVNTFRGIAKNTVSSLRVTQLSAITIADIH